MKKALFLSLLLVVMAGMAFAEGIAVLQPAGGELWAIGSTQVIKWKFESEGNAQPVNIQLFKDGVPVGKIAQNVSCDLSGTGSFKWQVGTLLQKRELVLESQKVVQPGKGYVIGVKVVNTLINGESRAFMIQ